MKLDKLKVAIIIPAYNEDKTIEAVIKSLRQTLKQHRIKNTIIVVDDGSSDNTTLSAKNAGAYVISHIFNAGCGAATATGLQYAKQHGFALAATMDADGQHQAKDVLQGIKLMHENNYDLLVGNRLSSGQDMPFIKLIGNRGLAFITYCLFGVRTIDSQSGLRLFSKKAINHLSWKTVGYEFCSEMFWRAKELNLKIADFPISAIYTEYSITKGQTNLNAFHIVGSLFKHRLIELFNE